MNAIKNLEHSILEQQNNLAEIKEAIKDRDFYKRLLVQAVLSHEGVLKINPAMAEEAFKVMNTQALEFGNGKVCFHKKEGSIFKE